MPRAQEKDKKPLLTREEWRARRELRREKQRKDNVKRAAKMHAARLKIETDSPKPLLQFKQSVFVGCSGWRYWKWRDSFYEGVLQNDWFGHYDPSKVGHPYQTVLTSERKGLVAGLSLSDAEYSMTAGIVNRDGTVIV
jgi:hypothetical protein